MHTIYEVFDLTADGRGVARQPGGRIVFIRGALPGDKVIAHIHKTESKGPLSGWVEELIAASPHRIEHLCPHFVDGCTASPLGAMQDANAEEWKQQHVRETLKRIARMADPPVSPIIRSPDPWAYRDRIELSLEWRKDRWNMGYRHAREVLPIRTCLLVKNPVQQAQQRLAASLANGGLPAPEGRWQRGLRLLLRDNGAGDAVAVLFVIAQRAASTEPLAAWLNTGELAGWQIRRARTVNSRMFDAVVEAESGRCDITLPIGDKAILLNPTTFSQANHGAAFALLAHVLDQIPKDAHLLDLYGGFGYFALHHALRGGTATVVESAEEAVETGRNFAANQALKVQYIQGDLSQPGFLKTNLNNYDSVLLDPPRKGAHKPVLSRLNRHGPDRLIYVSCHSAALARDLGRLPMYRPVEFTPVDLFPQTPEVEVVAVLERKLRR